MSDNRRRKVTGVHNGLPNSSRWKKMNAPPEGEPFIWFTREMLESPAWRVLSKPAQGVVLRIAIEHMSHAGTQNGDLPVTYTDFESYGVRRKSIPDAIAEAEALGWIDIVERGRRGYADIRRPSKYGLTWLPRAAGGMPPSNRWKRQRTMPEARAVLKEAKRRRQKERETRREQETRRRVRQSIAASDMDRTP